MNLKDYVTEKSVTYGAKIPNNLLPDYVDIEELSDWFLDQLGTSLAVIELIFEEKDFVFVSWTEEAI